MEFPRKKENKKCIICGETKPFSEFIIYQCKCKPCMKNIKREYYLNTVKPNNIAKFGERKVGRPKGSKKICVDESKNII